LPPSLENLEHLRIDSEPTLRLVCFGFSLVLPNHPPRNL